MTFSCLSFAELSNQQLYDIMALRQEVFVVEQNCPYLDADGKDQHGWHLLGYNDEGVLAAYTRLLPPGISYKKYASIGRVVTAAWARGNGSGKLLMNKSIEKTQQLFPDAPIKISAQCYLNRFYTELGFEVIGESYLEDDIPHVAMVLKE